MKIIIAVGLAAALSGCDLAGSEQVQLSALQQQVSALSQQVQALKKRSAAAESMDVQSKCAVDARRTFEYLGYSYSKKSNGAVVFYATNYDARTGRCYMLLSQNNLAQQAISQDLFDANTQISYGSIFQVNGLPVSCEMDPNGKVTISGATGERCSSELQFDQYVARYLGTASN